LPKLKTRSKKKASFKVEKHQSRVKKKRTAV